MKKALAILLSTVIVIMCPLVSYGLENTKISFHAINTFYNEWNRYYKNQQMDCVGDYYSAANNEEIDLIGITFNIEQHQEDNGIDGLPSTTAILVLYNTNTMLFDISFVNDSLTNTLMDVSFYTDEGIIHPNNVYSEYEGTGLWLISFDYDTLISLFMMEKFVIAIQTEEEQHFIDWKKASNSIIYTLIANTISACWYSDKTSNNYLDSSLLPDEDQVNESKSNTSSYSFQEDYDALERCSKSVFYVDIYDDEVELIGSASGFVLFDEHLFVTNQHVIEGASYLKIWDENDNGYVLDKVIAVDKSKDLAILAFPEGMNYEALDYLLEAELKRGQPVTTIGSPKGMQNTVAFGNISAFPTMQGIKMIQFTAPISQGSSGGVLFDNKGNVIGMTSSILKEGENIGFAMPVDELYSLYKQWNKKSYFTLGTPESWGVEKKGSQAGQIKTPEFSFPVQTEKPSKQYNSLILTPQLSINKIAKDLENMKIIAETQIRESKYSNLNYKESLQNPAKFENQLFKVTGTVLQVLESNSGNFYCVVLAMNNRSSEQVVVQIFDTLNVYLALNDVVTIYGKGVEIAKKDDGSPFPFLVAQSIELEN